VIIDDQVSARRGIALVLEGVPGLEVIAEFSDADAALDGLGSLAPDVAFVDIRMPGLSGLDLVRRAGRVATEFVFVTAYDDHAVAAFDLAAADYVLKPFTDERLIGAAERALVRVRTRRWTRALDRLGVALEDGGTASPLGAATEDRGSEPRYVTVSEGDRIRLVPIAEITHLKADRNHVCVVTAAGGHMVRSTLRELLRSLATGRFIQIHRSHAVNIDAVKEIQPWFNGDYIALMRGGEKLRVSRRYKAAILRRVL
jgi:two-component system LytT family response regulator